MHVTMRARGIAAGFALATVTTGGAPSHSASALPRAALEVKLDGGWHTWWRSSAAPGRWAAPESLLARALAWRSTRPGVEWGELELSGSGEAWRTRAIAVRIDPRRVRVRLDTSFTARFARASWSIDAAPRGAAVAVNAGQFVSVLPWGWVQLRGHAFLEPAAGPLSSALAFDDTGAVRWAHGTAAVAALARERGIAWALQSYPTLLVDDGTVPAPLRDAGGGVDLAHRDARLAIGELRDGRLLIVMTRFDAAGASLGFIPFGLTVPEMAAVMGALGCRAAVMLDGGISAQLLVREGNGTTHAWAGVRRVPVGMVVLPR